jgi:hypothetical protein
MVKKEWEVDGKNGWLEAYLGLDAMHFGHSGVHLKPTKV